MGVAGSCFIYNVFTLYYAIIIASAYYTLRFVIAVK